MAISLGRLSSAPEIHIPHPSDSQVTWLTAYYSGQDLISKVINSFLVSLLYYLCHFVYYLYPNLVVEICINIKNM